jgi:hypothetical protein
MAAYTLQLDAPGEVRRGAPVPMTLRVENTSGRPIDLVLRGRTIAFDIVVARDNDVVWRRLEGEVIQAIIQLKHLEPHEVIELHASWDQRSNQGRRVGPGLYFVRGELLTDTSTPLATPSVPLRIVPD